MLGGSARSWFGVVAVLVAGVLFCYGLLPLAAFFFCPRRCSTSGVMLVSLVEAGLYTVLTFTLLRLVRRLRDRLLLLVLAALAADALQHTLTVWLF